MLFGNLDQQPMNYEDKQIPLRKHKHTLFGVAAVNFITAGKKILFSTNIIKNLVTSTTKCKCISAAQFAKSIHFDTWKTASFINTNKSEILYNCEWGVFEILEYSIFSKSRHLKWARARAAKTHWSGSIPDICHGHKDGVRGEKICHVEKFQISVHDR